MNPNLHRKIRQQYEFGFSVQAIAKECGVSVADVLLIVETRVRRSPREREVRRDHAQEAVAQLRRAGYDEAVIRANFPEASDE